MLIVSFGLTGWLVVGPGVVVAGAVVLATGGGVEVGTEAAGTLLFVCSTSAGVVISELLMT